LFVENQQKLFDILPIVLKKFSNQVIEVRKKKKMNSLLLILSIGLLNVIVNVNSQTTPVTVPNAGSIQQALEQAMKQGQTDMKDAQTRWQNVRTQARDQWKTMSQDARSQAKTAIDSARTQWQSLSENARTQGKAASEQARAQWQAMSQNFQTQGKTNADNLKTQFQAFAQSFRPAVPSTATAV
jgi:F0F1-type ATP synthase membrane subunit b/b'